MAAGRAPGPATESRLGILRASHGYFGRFARSGVPWLIPGVLLIVGGVAYWRADSRTTLRAAAKESRAVPDAPVASPWRATGAPATQPQARAAAAPSTAFRAGGDDEASPRTLSEQRMRLFQRLANEPGFDAATVARVRAIFDESAVLGQGNPALTQHPMTRRVCEEVRTGAAEIFPSHTRCQAANMVTVYNPEAGDTADSARLCIDQFEFPNVACEYPVVHATAREAALLCEALGKRLCDAHEWEGACAGALHPAADEYAWGHARPVMTWLHNRDRQVVWAYGHTKNHALCATGSRKRAGCRGGYRTCSSDTYPTGAFPECVSRFGVYDQHGNVAEHMSLPLSAEQLAAPGRYGATEMKGSWFIFASHEAHEDDCRWRAKDWHPSAVMDRDSHSNYHLGFRCCKSVE